MKAAARRLERIEAERARRRAEEVAPAREPVTRIEMVIVDPPAHRPGPDGSGPWAGPGPDSGS